MKTTTENIVATVAMYGASATVMIHDRIVLCKRRRQERRFHKNFSRYSNIYNKF